MKTSDYFNQKWFQNRCDQQLLIENLFNDSFFHIEKIFNMVNNFDATTTFVNHIFISEQTNKLNVNEYLINKKDPEPLQLICKTANDVSKVYWYINNKFYKASAAGEKQFFVPEEGPVKISCTDDKGRNRNITIRVRYVNL